jgi:hypothetical protein
MMICPLWGSTSVQWKDANWLWSECQIAEELNKIYESGIDARGIYEDNLWRNEPEKRKRLIRLICKVKGEEYDEKLEVKENVRVKVEDIRLVVKKVLDIEIKIKE